MSKGARRSEQSNHQQGYHQKTYILCWTTKFQQQPGGAACCPAIEEELFGFLWSEHEQGKDIYLDLSDTSEFLTFYIAAQQSNKYTMLNTSNAIGIEETETQNFETDKLKQR